ncbi:Magnesium and cobalt efflux protein CorC [hydrothermal vent metagenome]|uniref:Magnesium and cobalt efflux protein CorC n=1 Tax=hydrothermal vent metagenome TaxID=652676 RepID=A0A3B0YUH1_9ZZZZ
MNEDIPSISGQSTSTWFKRLQHVFTGKPLDRSQLLEVLRESQKKRGLLDIDALAMIEGVLQVSEMQVRDIMIPRSQMVVLERDMEMSRMLPKVVVSGHSRFPVIGESRDEVLGILLAKDMLRIVMEAANEQDNVTDVIRDVLRQAVFVPESKRLNVLLKEFRASHNHMAIVVDEYGGVAGMVTIEDVIEQIVGEIEDEHDIDEENYILKHSDSRYTVKALTDIADFNEYFSLKFSDEEFDTVGGLLLSHFSHVPKRNESIRIGKMTFKVLRADNRRIHLLQLTLDVAKELNESVSGKEADNQAESEPARKNASR